MFCFTHAWIARSSSQTMVWPPATSFSIWRTQGSRQRPGPTNPSTRHRCPSCRKTWFDVSPSRFLPGPRTNWPGRSPSRHPGAANARTRIREKCPTRCAVHCSRDPRKSVRFDGRRALTKCPRRTCPTRRQAVRKSTSRSAHRRVTDSTLHMGGSGTARKKCPNRHTAQRTQIPRTSVEFRSHHNWDKMSYTVPRSADPESSGTTWTKCPSRNPLGGVRSAPCRNHRDRAIRRRLSGSVNRFFSQCFACGATRRWNSRSTGVVLASGLA
jgi:hypothetical protein